MKTACHPKVASLCRSLAFRLLRYATHDDSAAFLRHKTLADGDQCLHSALSRFAELSSTTGSLLDVGGGDGSFVRSLLSAAVDRYQISTLDIQNCGRPGFINHDICLPIPDEYASRFDVVFSYNTLEHLANPLVAADNICKLVRPGGMVAVHTVFAWRYHPDPKDYFRFSDDALRHLFAERNNLLEQSCGYDLGRRRENIVGGFYGDSDIPPIDWLGGFRENWEVFFIGRKPAIASLADK